MTPRPTSQELSRRALLDRFRRRRGHRRIHINDFQRQIMDGEYAKDIISDFDLGLLLVARELGVVSPVTLQVLQNAFVAGGHLRYSFDHYDSSFKDHDGKIMKMKGRWLTGNSSFGPNRGNTTIQEFIADPRFAAWAKKYLYAGGSSDDPGTYASVHSFTTKKQVDAHVASIPYTPGPLSQPVGAIPFPFTKRTPASSRKPEGEGRKSSCKPNASSSKPKASSSTRGQTSIMEVSVSDDEGNRDGLDQDAAGTRSISSRASCGSATPTPSGSPSSEGSIRKSAPSSSSISKPARRTPPSSSTATVSKFGTTKPTDNRRFSPTAQVISRSGNSLYKQLASGKYSKTSVPLLKMAKLLRKSLLKIRKLLRTSSLKMTKLLRKSLLEMTKSLRKNLLEMMKRVQKKRASSLE